MPGARPLVAPCSSYSIPGGAQADGATRLSGPRIVYNPAMTHPFLPRAPHWATITLALAVPGGLTLAQEAPPDSVTPAGVVRAASVVDAVFVDRTQAEGLVAVGDWASYLMARLGIIPIPPDLRIRVTGDTSRVIMASRLGDLPWEARRALGPLLRMFPPETDVAGEISLTRVAREVVRFRLETVRVNGVPLPDPLVQSALFDVGRQYPALTKSGRDLFVEVPRDALVALEPGRVRLMGPPQTPSN